MKNTYKHNWKKINTNFPENKELKRGSKVRVEFIDKGFSIQDYYWTQEDYTRLMSNTGLKLIEIHQPLGLDSDGMDWMDEKFISPISVYITRKQ